MRVICRVCDRTAEYNRTLGIYYCEKHGYNITYQDSSDFVDEMVSSLEELTGKV